MLPFLATVGKEHLHFSTMVCLCSMLPSRSASTTSTLDVRQEQQLSDVNAYPTVGDHLPFISGEPPAA